MIVDRLRRKRKTVAALRAGIFNFKATSPVFFATIVAFVGILFGGFSFSQSAYAATLSLSVSDNITATALPNSTSGTTATSSTTATNISVSTDNVTGYTLSLKHGSSTSAPALNGSGTSSGSSISSISSEKATLNDFTSGTWGYKPTKKNGSNWNNLVVKHGETNYTSGYYLPGPTTTADIIDVTDAANSTANEYNLALATKIDTSTKVGSYSNYFIVEAVTNEVPYVWEKYSLKTEYSWDKYNAEAKTVYKASEASTSTTLYPTVKSSKTTTGSVPYSSSITVTSSTISLSNPTTLSISYNGYTSLSDVVGGKYVCCTNTQSSSSTSTNCAATASSSSNTCYKTTSTAATRGTGTSRYYTKIKGYKLTITSDTEYVKGSTYYGEVTSADSSAYPADGTPDNTYWYVSKGGGQVKDTKIGEVIGADASAYPCNGIKDGYWYIFKGDGCPVTVNFAGEGVQSVTFSASGQTTQTITTSGDTASIAPDVSYTLSATLSSDHVVDTWVATQGTLGSTSANPTTYTTGYGGDITVTGKEYTGPPSMQDFSCSSLASGVSTQLADARDNKVYWVTKLADGNCWMTQNLDLVLSTSTTLTPSDSNVSSNWTPENNTQTYQYKEADGTTIHSDAKWNSDYNTKAHSYRPASDPSAGTSGKYGSDSDTYFSPAYITNGTTMSSYKTEAECIAGGNSQSDCQHWSVGTLYSWYAATAGTGNANVRTDGQNVTDSICPKGWHLPSSTSSGEFQALVTAASLTGSNITASPYYFLRAGYYSGNYGAVYTTGGLGNYWSRMSSSNTDAAYDLDFNSSDVNPSSGSTRYSGFSIRCVAGS